MAEPSGSSLWENELKANDGWKSSSGGNRSDPLLCAEAAVPPQVKP